MKFYFLSALVILFGFIALTAQAVDIKFVGSEITFSPASPISGDLMTFTATFRPVGGAVDNFKITGEIDGVQLFERVYAHINEGATKTDSFTWTAVTGKHHVTFKLDPDNVQGDTDYKDNWQSKLFTVPLPASQTDGPNLLIKNVSLSPVLIVQGTLVTFTVTLQNNGTMPASQFEASFRLDVPGSPWQAKHVDILLNGAQKNITFKWNVVCGATLTINADEYNAVMELNESDNLWVKKMTCFKITKPLVAVKPNK
jgi:subtilase family serine protease